MIRAKAIKSLGNTLYYTVTDPPVHPSGFTVEIRDFQTKNFSILLLWEVQRTDDIYYTITVNTTLTVTTHNMSMLPILLEGIYNIPVNVSLTAINCAGTSASVTEYVHESKFQFLVLHNIHNSL